LNRIAFNRIAFNQIAFNQIALRCWRDVPNARRRFGKRGTKGPRACPTPAFANRQSSAEASGTIGILHAALASRLDVRDSGLVPNEIADLPGLEQYRRSTVVPRQTPNQ
jgi:hypothetical protein